MKPSVAIICSDSITSLGINALLRDHFNADTTIITPAQQQMLASYAMSAGFDFIMIDEAVLIQNLSYFLPYRNKLILLTNSALEHETDFHHLLRTASLDSIISSVSKIFKSASKATPKDNHLSTREIEVLKLVAEGKLNKEIAKELNISINTVLTHRKNITTKLGIKSVSGLSFYALMNGFVKP